MPDRPVSNNLLDLAPPQGHGPVLVDEVEQRQPAATVPQQRVRVARAGKGLRRHRGQCVGFGSHGHIIRG